MPDLWIKKYKFQHRLEGVINGIDEEIVKILEGALEKLAEKLQPSEPKERKPRALSVKRNI